MNIESIARKLRPLRPNSVDRWLTKRAIAEPELRELIDHQIRHTAQRVLGDVENQPLLSLPPARTIDGPLHLGTVLYAGSRHTCGLRLDELLQNIVILGRSGAGKTNVVLHLLEQLAARKIAFVFLDWKRNARQMLPRLKGPIQVYTPGRSIAPLSFNPFVAPPGIESDVYGAQIVDLLGAAYTLGDGASSLVQKALTSSYSESIVPTPTSLLDRLEREPIKGRAAGWYASARRALETLTLARLSRDDPATQSELVAELLHGRTIIELDALNQNAKRFLVPALLLWMYHVQLATRHRERLQVVLIIEEAHQVLFRSEHRSHETVMNTLLRQFRELGIGTCVVDQHAHLLSSAALGNSIATICMNQKDPADVSKAAALTGVSDEDKRWLSRLPIGQGIVRLQDRWHEPFLVQFPHVKLDKGAVDDAALRSYIAQSTAGSRREWRLGRNIGHVPQCPNDDDPLDDVAMQLIQDVLDHPDDGVKARYRRLRFSGSRGHACKEWLVNGRWLETQTILVGLSRKVLLRLTTAARQALGLTELSQRRESLAHEYWKRFYARRFAADGHDVKLEAQRKNGRADLVATRADIRIAIEIETGRSNAVENVRNDLRSGFNRIIVVATDESALNKVERQLAVAGLLVPRRVELVLRDRELAPKTGFRTGAA